MMDSLLQELRLDRNQLDEFINSRSSNEPKIASKIRDWILTHLAPVNGEESDIEGSSSSNDSWTPLNESSMSTDRSGAPVEKLKMSFRDMPKTLLNETIKLIPPTVNKPQSSVFIAQDKSLNRKVAVKIIGKTSEDFGEARLLAEVSGHSPFIVKIFQAFTEGGITYFIMEYVEHTLRSFAKESKEDISMEVLEYAIQALRGLEYLHSENWYHCDIKPDNIGVFNGGAVLLDFGLAHKDTDKRASGKYLTTENGTDGYKSPEREMSPMADVYAFGMTLEAIFPKCDNGSRLGKGIRNIITKATLPKSERYQSASEMRADLDQLYLWEDNSSLPEWLKLPRYFKLTKTGYEPENIISCWYQDSEDFNFDVPERYRESYDKLYPEVEKWMKDTGKWDGIIYGLRNCVISRTPDTDEPQLILHCAKSRYLHSTVMHKLLNEVLPKEFPSDHSFLKHSFGTFDMDIRPFTTVIGVHVSVITNDAEPKLLFCQKFALESAFYNTQSSITCGITETVGKLDIPNEHAPPDIYRTAIRGLLEEINVDITEEYRHKIKFFGLVTRKSDNVWGFIGVADMRGTNSSYNLDNIMLGFPNAKDGYLEFSQPKAGTKKCVQNVPLDIRAILLYIKNNYPLLSEGAVGLAISVLFYCFDEKEVTKVINEMRSDHKQ